jgi:hypothetical protein
VIRRTRNLLAGLALATAAAAIMAGPAQAAPPGPAWRLEGFAAPSHFVPGDEVGHDIYTIHAINTGNANTDGSRITVTDELPPGFSVLTGDNFTCEGTCFLSYGILTDSDTSPLEENCTLGTTVVCHLDRTLVPGERLTMRLPLKAPASGPPTVTNHVTVSGGGAAPVSFTETIPFDSEPLHFGLQYAEASLSAADGSASSQAGSHPYNFRFGFAANTSIQPAPNNTTKVKPVEGPKDVEAQLPAGFLVNPTATPRCTEAQLETVTGFGENECPDDSAVGTAQFGITPFGFPADVLTSPLYNLVPTPDAPAQFAFQAGFPGIDAHVTGNVDPTRGYALRAGSRSITQYGGFSTLTLDYRGDPSDPAFDFIRGNCAVSNTYYQGDSCPVAASEVPLLSMPSACSASLDFGIEADSWQNKDPGGTVDFSTSVTDNEGNPTPVTGCEALEFEPTLEARPTTNVADSPSGLEVDLHVPQTNNLNTPATANLKKAVVSLPEGITLNPSAANGLASCSSSQIGLVSGVGQAPIRFDGNRPTCPDASKLGTVEVDTPLLEDPAFGSIYLAKSYENPFNSLVAIYLAFEGDGALVKLAGHVEIDPATGKLTTTFDENPQLPFEDFKLDFFGGSRGALRTPPACGQYSTTSQLTPWSGTQPVSTHDDYSISQGPGGGCATSAASQPFTPSFDAGTVTPIAGAHSPFVVHLRRNDGTQGFSSVTLSPPPGLVGTLAGIAPCSDAALAAAEAKSGTQEQASPSCPAGSQVGTAVAGAGAGPAPYYAPAKVYLAGPYKGAPLSFAVITPAVAGPFDLGTVVTRVAAHINPATARITADADPIPASLKGIPLDVRSIDLSLDRQGFTQNGTSCDPSSVEGKATSLFAQVASLSARFQLAECEALAFKPKMSLRLKGPTKRGRYPQLTAVLSMPEGQADIASVSVALPHSEFLAQEHIRTICTRVQFAADQCPARAVYGQATVTTPLLGYPLSGNVYLRASNNKLPDVVPDLRGPAWQPIRLEAAGRTDSINGGIRNTFEFVPDAPFSKLVVQLQGGQKSLLQNSTNICAKPERATVKYTAHNGDAYEEHPLLKAQCPKKRKGHHSHHKRGAAR